ncbi:MAG: SGNH/GDSL hydrolase family protein, partial [Myxococcaceae bacterium]
MRTFQVLGSLAVLGMLGACDDWRGGVSPQAPVNVGGVETDAGTKPKPDPTVDSGVPDSGTPVNERTLEVPAFTHALRWSVAQSSITTFRFRIPVTESGNRVRVAFKAGDGTMNITRASIGPAGTGGALSSAPVAVRFENVAGTTLSARTRVVSDWVTLPVSRGQELYVSFEASGALSASAITNYPDSWSVLGSFSQTQGAIPGAEPQTLLMGVTGVSVEAKPLTPRFLAIGDSITEGYMVGTEDDIRKAWPELFAKALGAPVANASVSGQGLDDALKYFAEDVGSIQNVTDCVVLVGTTDLHVMDVPTLAQKSELLYSMLRPHCRVWAATLVPKERTSVGVLEEVQTRRKGFNAWLRGQANVEGVVDFEAVLRAQQSPALFAEGMDTDQIHPSAA